MLDILHEMEIDPDMAGIRFVVTPAEDGKYGTLIRGRWNGMIRKLRDRVRKSLIRHDLSSPLGLPLARRRATKCADIAFFLAVPFETIISDYTGPIFTE